MKLYAPKYYKIFVCIADKCDHSCCVGWEIDIDSQAYQKYKALDNGYAQSILDSISVDGTPHFKLKAGDRCPHLNSHGLCKIILNVGEEYLCDICREHPRFYNYTDVAEVGLGMSCKEAARLVLSSPDYDVMEALGEVNATEDECAFNGRLYREEIYKRLKDKTQGYNERLEGIYRGYGIDVADDGYLLEVIDSLEYLDAAHKALFLKYTSTARPVGKDEYLERALAYFIYRHLTEATCEESAIERLSFCLLLERLFASLICAEKAETLEDLASLASIISEELEYSEDNTAALMFI